MDVLGNCGMLSLLLVVVDCNVLEERILGSEHVLLIWVCVVFWELISGSWLSGD